LWGRLELLMIVVVSLLGLLVRVGGFFLYRKQKAPIGIFLILMGAALFIMGVVLGAVAILNFHP
jgi:hypothetical protein